MSQSASARIRLPSVAGQFYPADPGQLDAMLAQLLARAENIETEVPKAIIAPHAGYIYSGPVAATVYKKLQDLVGQIDRVVVLSPAHRFGFRGIAWSDVDYFRTPLGDIPVDRHSLAEITDLEFVQPLENAFNGEHALEVHLPFLQKALGSFQLVPFVVGMASAEQVATLLQRLWGDERTLIVVSSDLSHFHDYNEARQLDRRTAKAISQLDYVSITGNDACGVYPLSGLLLEAARRGMHIDTVDLRNSGDTAGNRDRVVGYGSFVMH
jgi:AmmeMemoRadiSam system protein B